MDLSQEYERDVIILTTSGKQTSQFKFNPKVDALVDPVFAAYVEVLYFWLANRDFLNAGLIHLEEAFVAQLGGSSKEAQAKDYFKAQGNFFRSTKNPVPDPKGNVDLFDARFRGALTKVLYASQVRGGFKVEKQVTIAKAYDPSYMPNIHAFAKLQQLMQHFKDVNAGKDHGEFTHQIQWYMITEKWGEISAEMARRYEVKHSQKPDASHLDTPGKLMAEVGKTGMAAVGVWPMLFDRLADDDVVYPISTDVNAKLDGRCPEKLHLYALGMASPCPTLKTFLAARYAKRDVEAQNESFNYYEKKFGTRAYEKLNFGHRQGDVDYLTKDPKR